MKNVFRSIYFVKCFPFFNTWVQPSSTHSISCSISVLLASALELLLFSSSIPSSLESFSDIFETVRNKVPTESYRKWDGQTSSVSSVSSLTDAFALDVDAACCLSLEISFSKSPYLWLLNRLYAPMRLRATCFSDSSSRTVSNSVSIVFKKNSSSSKSSKSPLLCGNNDVTNYSNGPNIHATPTIFHHPFVRGIDEPVVLFLSFRLRTTETIGLGYLLKFKIWYARLYGPG